MRSTLRPVPATATADAPGAVGARSAAVTAVTSDGRGRSAREHPANDRAATSSRARDADRSSGLAARSTPRTVAGKDAVGEECGERAARTQPRPSKFSRFTVTAYIGGADARLPLARVALTSCPCSEGPRCSWPMPEPVARQARRHACVKVRPPHRPAHEQARKGESSFRRAATRRQDERLTGSCGWSSELGLFKGTAPAPSWPPGGAAS